MKREKPILVVLANPPYNAFAGTSPQEEGGLVRAYKESLNTSVHDGGWGIRKFNLDDLYVRFFRIAERRIVANGRGIVSFISNFSYLDRPSFVVMRKRFLEEFDQLWFDCMNGDSRETGKLTPEGQPDPSVFSTEHNREGIRVGTAVCLLVRKGGETARPTVRFRHFWGAAKRRELLGSLKAKRFSAAYSTAKPSHGIRYSFRSARVTAEYSVWPALPELCAVPASNGLMEKRAGALFDVDRPALEQRMRAYWDRTIVWAEYQAICSALTQPRGRFDPVAARARATSTEPFLTERIVPYAVKPLDVRWCYYTGVRPVWNEPRPRLWAQCWPGNSFLVSRPTGFISPEGAPLCFTSLLGDNALMHGSACFFPLRLKNKERLHKKDEMALFRLLGDTTELEEPAANLSGAARAYLTSLGARDPDRASEAPLLWMHALAIGYAPAYLAENADGVRQDWPRIPLPATLEVLNRSAALGAEVAALLDAQAGVSGVTLDPLRREMRCMGSMNRMGGGPLDRNAGELDLTAGWGHAGKGGVTMPGSGRVEERDYTRDERAAIEAGANALGLSLDEALAHLGTRTLDVFLNGVAFWRNVPRGVWDYFIGGYQVVKKWLSYREKKLLGRGLRVEEAQHVSEMVRRLAALRLLEPALDANYQAVKAHAFPFGGAQG